MGTCRGNGSGRDLPYEIQDKLVYIRLVFISDRFMSEMSDKIKSGVPKFASSTTTVQSEDEPGHPRKSPLLKLRPT